MFKNLMVYRLGPQASASLEQWETALAASPFAPCGAHEEKSSGWLPPRGHAGGAFVESVGGQWIARFMVETKAVPGAVLRRKADELAAEIEASTGRRPGKKERRGLRDDALQRLLPQAFARESSLWVWIDPQARRLMLDTSSSARADDVLSALADAFSGAGAPLDLALLPTQTTPQAAMSAWLADEAGEAIPAAFAIEREVELRSTDEERSVVKFTRHLLQTDEVRRHIAEGKLPVKLALGWQDRASLVLTDAMHLKRLKLHDLVFEDQPSPKNGDESFDADVAIATAEYAALIAELIEALGGELPAAEDRAAPATAAKAPAPAASGGGSALPWETDAEAAARQASPGERQRA
jgi:recombination associated protein RdgC